MKFHSLFALLIASALLFGCAKPPLSAEQSNSLKSGKLAVAYIQAEKRIQYQELLYRVFWNETRTNDVSFEGLWDIDTEISAYISPKVCQLGLNAVPINKAISDKDIKDLHDTFNAQARRESPVVLNDGLRAKLVDSGVDHLITLHSNYIFVFSQIGASGSPLTWMYVHDVRSNKQIYADYFPIGGELKFNQSVREIESNDLAGLKSAMNEWMDAAVLKSMPERLGLSK